MQLGMGVRLASIDSYRSAFVDHRVNDELQSQGEFGAASTALQQVESVFNESQGSGLQSALTAFFNSFSSLAATPEDVSLRQQVLARGDDLAALAGEIRSQRDQILSLANTQVRGRYIFGGSNVTSPAFAIAGDTVTYQGDSEVNRIDVSNGLQVQENIFGSTVFDPIFASVTSLLTAVAGGDQAAIKSALSQFSGALSTVNQVRSRLGVDLGKLQDAVITRQDLQGNIKTRQSQISDADMVEAIAEINRIQTALKAALSVGSLLGQKSLMDYLV